MDAFRQHTERCFHCSNRTDVLDLCDEGRELARVMFASGDDAAWDDPSDPHFDSTDAFGEPT
jgi:hypothetical protein